MRYQVLILMAKEKLAAMDVDADGKAEAISIEGNAVMKYGSEDGVKEFCRYLKDYYNIEEFSDIDLSITVIRFDALQHDTICMFEQLKAAGDCNLISVERLLPLLVLKEGVLKPGRTVLVEIFGSTYSVGISNNLKIECKKGGKGQDKLKLPVERLSLYYYFDANNLIDNKSELKRCQEEFQRELSEKKDLLNQFEKRMQDERARADTAEAKIEWMYSYICQIKNQKSRSVERCICKFKEKKENVKRSPSWLTLLTPVKYQIEYVVDNLDILKKYQRVAIARGYCNDTRNSAYDTFITASGDGRVYLLKKSGAIIHDGDAVAIIGDLSDSREEIMQWYEKNK